MSKYYYLSLIVALIGCGNSTKSPEYYAKEYCDCMEKNNAHKDYYNARIICDSKLIQQNVFFRITFVEALYGPRYITHYSKDTLEYAHELKRDFYRYLEKNCPSSLPYSDSTNINYSP